MGLCNSPNISQEKMYELFVSLDTVRFYIDEILKFTKGYWTDHLTVPQDMFARLHKDGLMVNADKSCFGDHKFEYLSHHATRDGVIPIPKKV